MPESFTKVYIDAPSAAVEVHMKEPAEIGRLLALAKSRNPEIDITKAKVQAAKYSARQLDSARRKLLAASHAGLIPVDIHAIGVPRDGSSLELHVSDPGSAASETGKQRSSAFQSQVALTFKKGAPARPAKSRFDDWYDDPDSRYFGAGSLLLFPAGNACTSGLPAQLRNTPSRPILVTAMHCGLSGDKVTTGVTSHVVGTTFDGAPEYDAIPIDVRPGHTDAFGAESDHPGGGIYGFGIYGVSDSINGDYVCQNGYKSYVETGKTVCAIKVTDDDVAFNLCPGAGRPCYMVSGVHGTKMDSENGGIAARPGDSGALVFAIAKPGDVTRQARGIVSAVVTSSGGKVVSFTQALRILGRLNLDIANGQ
ncbi:hypothetical protein [Actinomadura sp. 6N118]|uniref:hypothetical protein n=1 Tax=Actinomadura sp. 6N118 TaxID=3375151 RepID=UPI00378F2345